MDRSSRSLALTLALVGILGDCASAQNTPQQDYVWEMGRVCDGRYRDWYLDRAETVTGPAGTFAPHLSCTHRRGGALGFEVWYAPEVGNNVKERTVFSYGIRERELVGFKPAMRPTARRDRSGPAIAEEESCLTGT